MRILLANVYFSPSSFGGATHVVERAAQGLVAEGHDVLVVTANTDPQQPNHAITRYSALGVPVISMRVRTPLTEQSIFLDVDAGGRFGEILESFRPDVVHLHAIQTLSTSLAFECARRGVPFVMTMHDPWLLCSRQFMVRSDNTFCGQRRIDPDVCATCVADVAFNVTRHDTGHRVLDLASRVLAPSRYARDFWADNGVPPERLRVHGNGVARPSRRSAPRDASAPLVLGYVGGVGPIKGSDLVVKALTALGRDDYVLRVVDNTGNLGFSGTHEGQWQVPGRVDIVPAYDASSMDDFFEGIDVLLFPSQTKESYGLTVREALVRGRWVIATDSGGSAEDIVEGVNGHVVPMDGTADALARAIAAVLDDPALARSRQLDPTPVADQDDHVRDLVAILVDVVAEAAASGTVPAWRRPVDDTNRGVEGYLDV